jgi:hypothetical protein
MGEAPKNLAGLSWDLLRDWSSGLNDNGVVYPQLWIALWIAGPLRLPAPRWGGARQGF